MIGIFLTLIAVLMVIVLAFCTPEERSFERDGIETSWARAPKQRRG